MIIEIILCISVIINLFLGWYIYKLLKNMIQITDEFEEMRNKILEFAEHLKAVNSMETFYGDPTLTALVKHMKETTEEIERYSKVMVLYEATIEDSKEEE